MKLFTLIFFTVCATAMAAPPPGYPQYVYLTPPASSFEPTIYLPWFETTHEYLATAPSGNILEIDPTGGLGLGGPVAAGFGEFGQWAMTIDGIGPDPSQWKPGTVIFDEGGWGKNFSVSSVPEPSTILLAAIPLAALLFKRGKAWPF